MDVEDTALGDIISEEPTFSLPFGVEDEKEYEDTTLDSEEDASELFDDEEEPIRSMDLESLLASLGEEEMPSPNLLDDDGSENKTTGDELGPYTSNHEYLQRSL